MTQPLHFVQVVDAPLRDSSHNPKMKKSKRLSSTRSVPNRQAIAAPRVKCAATSTFGQMAHFLAFG